MSDVVDDNGEFWKYPAHRLVEVIRPAKPFQISQHKVIYEGAVGFEVTVNAS